MNSACPRWYWQAVSNVMTIEEKRGMLETGKILDTEIIHNDFYYDLIIQKRTSRC